MGDGVTRIDVKPTQSVKTTAGSSPAGSLQELPPYGQQLGATQAASSAPMCAPYHQQFGSVQPAPAVPIGPPYNQQVESVQPASAAPIGNLLVYPTPPILAERRSLFVLSSLCYTSNLCHLSPSSWL
ncbi:uncharacterized protein LOC141895562 isoform X1 [Acropora palmata]|uniref:uncharacterized protein LOC141895562 isoform X1 n=1 Tax=Acropora palmata TaxID=6131 RepID=UPI003DA06238